MTIYLPLLVCLIGMVLFLVCGPYPPPANASTLNTKVGILGLVAFGCGLLAFLLVSGGHPLNVIH
jgi:hypothetical protein